MKGLMRKIRLFGLLVLVGLLVLIAYETALRKLEVKEDRYQVVVICEGSEIRVSQILWDAEHPNPHDCCWQPPPGIRRTKTGLWFYIAEFDPRFPLTTNEIMIRGVVWPRFESARSYYLEHYGEKFINEFERW